MMQHGIKSSEGHYELIAIYWLTSGCWCKNLVKDYKSILNLTVLVLRWEHSGWLESIPWLLMTWWCNETINIWGIDVSHGKQNQYSLASDHKVTTEWLCHNTISFLYNSNKRWSHRLLWGPGMGSLIARFMGLTWGPSGADRTQVGPMLAPWTLLSGVSFFNPNFNSYCECNDGLVHEIRNCSVLAMELHLSCTINI